MFYVESTKWKLSNFDQCFKKKELCIGSTIGFVHIGNRIDVQTSYIYKPEELVILVANWLQKKMLANSSKTKVMIAACYTKTEDRD